MTDRDRDHLRATAEAHADAGCRTSKLILWLLAERDSLVDALRRQIDSTDALAATLRDLLDPPATVTGRVSVEVMPLNPPCVIFREVLL